MAGPGNPALAFTATPSAPFPTILSLPILQHIETTLHFSLIPSQPFFFGSSGAAHIGKVEPGSYLCAKN